MADPVDQWLEDSLSLPGRLQRDLRLMAELDAASATLDTQARVREADFMRRLEQLKEAGAPLHFEGMDDELRSIEAIQRQSRALLREKVEINMHAAAVLHAEQQALAAERQRLLQNPGVSAAAGADTQSTAVAAVVEIPSSGSVSRRKIVGERTVASSTGADYTVGASGSQMSRGWISAGDDSALQQQMQQRYQGQQHEIPEMIAAPVHQGVRCFRNAPQGESVDTAGNMAVSTSKASRGRILNAQGLQAVQVRPADASVNNSAPRRSKKGGDGPGLSIRQPSSSTAASSASSTPSECLRGSTGPSLSTECSYGVVGTNFSRRQIGGSPDMGSVGTVKIHTPGVHKEAMKSEAQRAHTSTKNTALECSDTWEGACPVCRKGEASSEVVKMVACDLCNRWFHFECVVRKNHKVEINQMSTSN